MESDNNSPELSSAESQASVVIGAATFLMLSATTAVALRLYTRKTTINHLFIDDFLVIGALVRYHGKSPRLLQPAEYSL